MSLGRSGRGNRVSTSPAVREAFPLDPLPPLDAPTLARGRMEAAPPAPPLPPPLILQPLRTDTEPMPVAPEPPAQKVVVDFTGLAESICACIAAGTKRILEELPDKIAKSIEQQLVTSRGIVVRAPPTCSQPVSATDVDDQVINQTIAATSPVGVAIPVLKRVAARSMILKGLNWQFSVEAAVKKPQDPAGQIGVTVLIDGRPAGLTAQGSGLPTAGTRTKGAYVDQRIPPAPGGIGALGACHIYVREGQTVELCAFRVTPPSGQAAHDFAISARWKGWDWTPTIDAPGATGVGGF